MKSTLTIYSLILSIACCSNASAFDFLTSRGNGLGQTFLLSQPSASTVLLVPTGGLTDGATVVELGVNRKFEIKDLDQGYLAAAYRRNSFTYALGFTQFGNGDLYAERTARLAAAYHYSAFAFSGNVSAMQVDFGGHYDNLSAIALGLGVGYRRNRIMAGLSVENLNSPRLDKHSEEIPPRLTIHAELVGPGPYSVTGRLAAQKREKPQFGAGQFVDISSFGSLFWGVSTGPLIYGAGVELSHKRSIITYATSYHPTLGFSHTLSVSFALGKQPPE